MKIKTRIIMPAFFILLSLVLIPSCVQKQETTVETTEIPYYFIAIHNEPSHFSRGNEAIEKAYPILEQMVDKANTYNIKLTIMFSAQWADYISKSPERLAKIKDWESQEHEIAAHHHGVRHKNWDGYTNYSKEEAYSYRLQTIEKLKPVGGLKKIKEPEEYLGTLDDYMQKLKNLKPEINSGCMNDEEDKNELPDEIIYDTCSGFANFGSAGTKLSDVEPEKGRNEFISVGEWNGIKRKWLAHYQLYHDVKAGEKIFDSMNSGAYGIVVHSSLSEAEDLYEYFEFLHSRDPKAEKSRTLSEIIKQGLLPEKEISNVLRTETGKER